MTDESDELEGHIESALERVLDKRDAIGRETHAKHHRWVDYWIARQEQREERRQQIMDRVKGTVVGSLILGALGWLFSNLEKMGQLLSILWRSK